MRIFMLDDDEGRRITLARELEGHDLTFAVGTQEADKFQPFYDIVFLDHDLGLDSDDGRQFIHLIAPKLTDPETKDFTAFVVHSWNVQGAERMVNELSKLGCFAQTARFGGPEWRKWMDTIQTAKHA